VVAPIVIENLSFRYPGQSQAALRDVNLQVNQGECVILLGPTGCGKSTLALCLNGLIPHLISGELHGHVYIHGVDTRQAAVSELAQAVGLVFQDPEAQFCMLTVEDEIAFGLENLGLPRQEMDGRIESALNLVGLSEERHVRLDRLSGGTKQRLALAAVLAMGPRILVLDEPTSNLDPRGTADFFAHLATLKEQGYTILLIEHKLDDLMDLVDQVAVLGPEGHLIANGDPRSVFRENSARLLREGIWLPQVTELAFRLAQSGTPVERFPVDVAEALDLLTPLVCRRSPAPCVHPSLTGRDARKGPDYAGTSGDRVILQAASLAYTYPRGAQALRGLNLEVKEREFLALVGANGSGKTTLALHLCGILTPSLGKVLLDGHEVSTLPREQVAAQVGYVFQNPEHQFVTGTVFEELAYGLRLHRVPEAEVQVRVASLLDEFALTEYADMNPFKLSQGQKRRLSVATMLILGQKVLILDEPTFGQDRANAYRLMDELRNLQQNGHTILFATHDMRLVAEYATRAVVLDKGRVLFDGHPRELFAQPEMLHQAQLNAPTLYALSLALVSFQPAWPPLATIAEYCACLERLCA